MQEKIELIDGKFVVKGRQQPKPAEHLPQQKEYPEEVIALRDRVINGNQKLFDAWLKIRELAHDTEEWARQMDRWHEATQKLHLLCSELKLRGYETCLYIDNTGKKTKSCVENSNGWWCIVCSSQYPYWEKELFDLGDKKEETNEKSL